MKSPAKKKVLKELQNVPVISVAAKAAGISRQTVYRWMQEDTEFNEAFKKAIKYGVRHINDMSESQLISMIKDGKWPVIKYWLSNHHNDYKETFRTENQDMRKDEELNNEEMRILDEMLAKFIKPKQ